MDVIITILQREIKYIDREDSYATSLISKNITPVQYWKINKKPKRLKIGDRVYFLVNKEISYYHEFLGFSQDPTCDMPKRSLDGLHMMLKWPEIDCEPVKMKPFRGFRYKFGLMI